MGFFSSIGSAFKKVGSGVVSTVGKGLDEIKKVPVVGDAVGLAEQAEQTAVGIGKGALKTAGIVTASAQQATQQLATDAPKILKQATNVGSSLISDVGQVGASATGTIQAVDQGISGLARETPGIVKSVSSDIDTATQGIFKNLPLILGVGGLALILLNRER